MTKKEKQKLTLRKTAILSSIVVVVSLAIVVGVSYFYSSLENDLSDTTKEVRALNNRQNVLDKKFTKAKNSLRLYQNIVQDNSKEDFSLNRELATSILDTLNKRYHLSNLSVSISPVQELKNDSMQNKSSVVIYSEVALKFQGASDELVMGFVNDIAKQFLGYVNIVEFSMIKEREIDGDVLYAVSKGKKPSAVSGAMKFLWLGLKLDEPPTIAKP